jgi:Protein of unknown function DUF262
MSLEEEIKSTSREIQTDAYAMSVGELINLYRDREMDIHPEFQRLYRWTRLQKSRFIESILLGIPIPSIFVAQQEDGTWDVVDGLQRLSTIFEFTGDLRRDEVQDVDPEPLSEDDDVDDDADVPLKLLGTAYLPSLEGKTWGQEDGDTPDSLSGSQRLLIKRAKIDIKIIKRESDEKAKYDLFQRLNTGGSQLSDQEVRNALLIMINQDFYRWLRALRDQDAFQDTVAASDRQRQERYDVELVLRFFACKNAEYDDLNRMRDMGDFLDQSAMDFAESDLFAYELEKSTFTRTFALLDSALADSAFRRFDPAKNRFLGGFSVSAFETVAVGVGSHIDAWEAGRAADADATFTDLTERVKGMWSNTEFRQRSRSGVRASGRVPYLVPLGKQLYAK